MGKKLQSYSFISFFVFLMAVSKLYAIHKRFYDVCISLIENDFYRLIFVNFLFASGLFIIVTLFTKFAGSISNAEMSRAKNEISGLFFNTLIALTMTAENIEGDRLTFALFAFANRCAVLIMRQKIVSMSLTPRLPSKSQHHNILSMQLVLFFISFYYFVECLANTFRKKDSLAVGLSLQFFKGGIDCFLDIIKHIVFIFDRENAGNSQKSFYIMMYAEYFHAIFCFVSDFLTFGLFIFVCHIKFPIQLIHPIIETYGRMKEVIKKHKNWRKIMEVLKTKLPNATQEDLEVEDTCIICRLQMTTEDGKKLPCGHCLHLECLERWVADHDKCPMCQADLTTLIDDVNQEVNNNAEHVNNANIFNNIADRIRNIGGHQDADVQQQQFNQEPQPQPNGNPRFIGNDNQFNFEDIDDEQLPPPPPPQQQFPIRGRRMNDPPQQPVQARRANAIHQQMFYGQNVQQVPPRQDPEANQLNNILQQIRAQQEEMQMEMRRREEEEAIRYRNAHPQTPKVAPTVPGPKQVTYNFEDIDSDSD